MSTTEETHPAPVAERKPHELEAHGDVRRDDYYWLREKESSEVHAYLEAENAYATHVLQPTEALETFDAIRQGIRLLGGQRRGCHEHE